jgi:hypothetical protein
MGMRRADLDQPNVVPRIASKKIDRDNAVRWRAFEPSLCSVTEDGKILVPLHIVYGMTRSMYEELTGRISSLEEAVSRGYGAPMSKAEVLPMNPKPAAAEQAQPVASGTSVPGNEAEDLYDDLLALSAPLLAGQDSRKEKVTTTLTVPGKSNVVPLNIPQPANPGLRSAANDEQIEEPAPLDVIEAQDYELVIVNSLEDLASEYGMTFNEAAGILGREHETRNQHCMALHNGRSRTDVQLERAFRRANRSNAEKYFKSLDSEYLDWSAMVETPAFNTWADNPAPTTTFRQPQEVKRQARAEARRKNDIKEKLGWSLVAYRNGACERIASQAEPPDVRTSRSQLRAFRSWIGDRVDTFQRWMGLTTLDRAERKREMYHREYLAVQQLERKAAKRDPKLVSTGEVVRNYHRQWIEA